MSYAKHTMKLGILWIIDDDLEKNDKFVKTVRGIRSDVQVEVFGLIDGQVAQSKLENWQDELGVSSVIENSPEVDSYASRVNLLFVKARLACCTHVLLIRHDVDIGCLGDFEMLLDSGRNDVVGWGGSFQKESYGMQGYVWWSFWVRAAAAIVMSMERKKKVFIPEVIVGLLIPIKQIEDGKLCDTRLFNELELVDLSIRLGKSVKLGWIRNNECKLKPKINRVKIIFLVRNYGWIVTRNLTGWRRWFFEKVFAVFTWLFRGWVRLRWRNFELAEGIFRGLADFNQLKRIA